MALILMFNLALQVTAAFMIFLIGYLALFISLMIFLAIAKGVYEGAKVVRAHAVQDSFKPLHSAAAIRRESAAPVTEANVVPSIPAGATL